MAEPWFACLTRRVTFADGFVQSMSKVQDQTAQLTQDSEQVLPSRTSGAVRYNTLTVMNITIAISLCGLAVAVVGLLLSRFVSRAVKVKVHRALLGTSDCYFVTVTNVSLNREVEVTHVWFANRP